MNNISNLNRSTLERIKKWSDSNKSSSNTTPSSSQSQSESSYSTYLIMFFILSIIAFLLYAKSNSSTNSTNSNQLLSNMLIKYIDVDTKQEISPDELCNYDIVISGLADK